MTDKKTTIITVGIPVSVYLNIYENKMIKERFIKNYTNNNIRVHEDRLIPCAVRLDNELANKIRLEAKERGLSILQYTSLFIH